MVSIDDKIKIVDSECKGIWAFCIDDMFKYIYPFTTENISGYLPYFDLKDKSLLTVGSSGDQVINAILMGSKDISVIDLCKLAKEYYNLKKAAIMTLSRAEFLKYFCYHRYNGKKSNHYAFNKKSYLKMRDALGSFDKESLYFWDTSFYFHRPITIRRRLFNYDETTIKNLDKLDEYLKSDMVYSELKNNIDKANVEFNIGNVSDTKFDRGFDNIFLSNISSYSTPEGLKKIFNNMVRYLNDDGRMLVAYLYFTEDLDLNNRVEQFSGVLGILPGDIDMYSFDGVRGLALGNEAMKDSIITYKKVKKI